MTILLDVNKLNRCAAAVEPLGLLAAAHQYGEPGAGVEGVSFADSLRLRDAVTACVVAVGSITVAASPGTWRVPPEPRAAIVLRTATAAERFAELRAAMEQAGVPFLDDEAVRAEIRDRKGRRAGQDV